MLYRVFGPVVGLAVGALGGGCAVSMSVECPVGDEHEPEIHPIVRPDVEFYAPDVPCAYAAEEQAEREIFEGMPTLEIPSECMHIADTLLYEFNVPYNGRWAGTYQNRRIRLADTVTSSWATLVHETMHAILMCAGHVETSADHHPEFQWADWTYTGLDAGCIPGGPPDMRGPLTHHPDGTAR